MPAKELPLYDCHKRVRALKIQSIQRSTVNHDEFVLVFQEIGYEPIIVPGEMTARYMPKTGDYFVVYDDGYKSFSPAKAFEAGYSLAVAP